MDEDIKLPEPVAWAKPNGEDVITSTAKWLWRSGMPAFVDACSVPCFTADQLQAYARAAVEADRAARKPLTTKQACAEMARLEPEHDVYVMSFLAGVRFAERMHGIGE